MNSIRRGIKPARRDENNYNNLVEIALPFPIREIPDHATFRVKGANLAWLDKLGVSLSLAHVIWPTLNICGFQSIVFYTQFQYVKKCLDCSLFPNVNH